MIPLLVPDSGGEADLGAVTDVLSSLHFQKMGSGVIPHVPSDLLHGGQKSSCAGLSAYKFWLLLRLLLLLHRAIAAGWDHPVCGSLERLGERRARYFPR